MRSTSTEEGSMVLVAARIGAFILLLAAYICMESNDWPCAWARTHEIVLEAIRPERGFAYVTPMPAEYQSRRVILLEGTRVLGTNEHLHDGDPRAGRGALFDLTTAPLPLGFRQS